MSKKVDPQERDGVWDERRIEKKLQPNGIVYRVYKEDGEVSSVVVKFYDTAQINHELVTLQPTDFTTRSRSGQWLIYA